MTATGGRSSSGDATERDLKGPPGSSSDWGLHLRQLPHHETAPEARNTLVKMDTHIRGMKVPKLRVRPCFS
jgi:hypothetical protein